jgi:hypothetical protein
MRLLLTAVSFVIPWLIHVLYQPLNENWTVKRFGCGWPPILPRGGSAGWGFNANHFNLLLWIAVWLACVGFYLWSLSESRRAKRRVWLLGGGVGVITVMCVRLLAAEMWL